MNGIEMGKIQFNSSKLNPDVEMCGGPLFQVRPYYFNGDCFTLVVPECLAENGVVGGFYDRI